MAREKNLTLKVDAQVLLWARMRALRDGTSINRRLRRYLEEYAAIPPEKRWVRATAPAIAPASETEEDEEAGEPAAGPAGAEPDWPEVDPGEAGSPGAPADHADLWGRDGQRVATSPEGRIRSELRHFRRLHRGRG
jgi:hypothetical protein